MRAFISCAPFDRGGSSRRAAAAQIGSPTAPSRWENEDAEVRADDYHFRILPRLVL
jgi:hypothetical protein